MHGDAVAHRVVIGERRVHLHLILAHLGAVVGGLAHQIGGGKSRRDVAELEKHVALDVFRAVRVKVDGIGRHRCARAVIGGQLADLQLDAPQRFLGGRLVDRRHGGDRLAAISHPIARQRILGAGDRQDAETLVAISAGDDCLDARQLRRFRDIHVENFGVRIRTAENAPSEHARLDEIGGVFGPSGYLFRTVDQRHIVADVMRRDDFVHGANSIPDKRTGNLTASIRQHAARRHASRPR